VLRAAHDDRRLTAHCPELAHSGPLGGNIACRGHQLEDEDDWCFEHPEVPTVWDDDPNPIIGEILDHRGEILCIVRMGPERHMGY